MCFPDVFCCFCFLSICKEGLLVSPRQEAKPGVERDKTKGEKGTREREREGEREREREMKMKSLKSDMHTWHAQTLSTCTNIHKQIFRRPLPLSRCTDWFTQMLSLSLSLWREWMVKGEGSVRFFLVCHQSAWLLRPVRNESGVKTWGLILSDVTERGVQYNTWGKWSVNITVHLNSSCLTCTNMPSEVSSRCCLFSQSAEP